MAQEFIRRYSRIPPVRRFRIHRCPTCDQPTNPLWLLVVMILFTILGLAF